jgi:hypothetical protein
MGLVIGILRRAVCLTVLVIEIMEILKKGFNKVAHLTFAFWAIKITSTTARHQAWVGGCFGWFFLLREKPFFKKS